MHISDARAQLIAQRGGVNGQFLCWERITTKIYGDIFISDLQYRMSSEVTQGNEDKGNAKKDALSGAGW